MRCLTAVLIHPQPTATVYGHRGGRSSSAVAPPDGVSNDRSPDFADCLLSNQHAINQFVSLDLLLQRGNSPCGHGQFLPQTIDLSPYADVSGLQPVLPLLCPRRNDGAEGRRQSESNPQSTSRCSSLLPSTILSLETGTSRSVVGRNSSGRPEPHPPTDEPRVPSRLSQCTVCATFSVSPWRRGAVFPLPSGAGCCQAPKRGASTP